MKLGVVNHYRCNEWSESRTVMLMPDEWSVDDFQKAVELARIEYLAFLGVWNARTDCPNKAGPYSKPDYSKFPDKTVAEVDADWAEQRKIYDAWYKVHIQGYQNFACYLERQGLMYLFDAEESDFVYDLDWGHNHGLPIDYSNNCNDNTALQKDLNG